MAPADHLKILCLAFQTPPVVRPQAILIGKMIPEWLRQDLTPILVGYNAPDWDLVIIRYYIPKLSTNRYLSKLPGWRRLAENKYYRTQAKRLAKLAKFHNIDLVFSFANPQASNLIGARLKKDYGLRFVSHFSDPWYDNDYQSVSTRQAKRILKQETEIVEQSDKIVFVSEQLKNLVMKKYPQQAAKAVVVPHCYNPQDYPATKAKTGQPFVISYIGAFYEQRNPELLFQAIQQLCSRQPHLKSRLKIQLVGSVNNYAGYTLAKIEDMLRQYDLKSLTEIIPTVPFTESLSLMKNADCLVVIDANFATSPFLPSKVIDYAGSDNHILGITPPGSATADFLKRLGYPAFSYSEVDKISEYLFKLINGHVPDVNHGFLSQFDVKNTTHKLSEVFRSIV